MNEPDEDVVAVRAADDGAQPPHLVNHRRSDLIDPSAALAGVMRGGYLEGEDLPEGASCGVAVQPVFVHRSNLLSVRSVRSLRARGRARAPRAPSPPPPPAVSDRRRRRADAPLEKGRSPLTSPCLCGGCSPPSRGAGSG